MRVSFSPPPLFESLEPRLLLSSAPTGFSPAQIRSAYGFDQAFFTTLAGQTIPADGAGQTIAIVTANAAPTIFQDLDTFSQTFSLNGQQSLYSQYGPAESFLRAVPLSSDLLFDSGWAVETALDVEWAHAIAPQADILLVQAASARVGDMLNAVDFARQQPGVSVVSMSWGGNEFAGESLLDTYFTSPANHNPVTFVSASGDSGAGTSWPAVSPNVLAVGGTTLTLDSANNYLAESAWTLSGGGPSLLFNIPSWQTTPFTPLNATRNTPDVAYNADPATGFSVFTNTTFENDTGWFTIGGTSAGAPQWAALIAIANQGRALYNLPSLDGPSQVFPTIYTLPNFYFNDITTGTNGFLTNPGYDLVTGRGSPNAPLIINALQFLGTPETLTFLNPEVTPLNGARSLYTQPAATITTPSLMPTASAALPGI